MATARDGRLERLHPRDRAYVESIDEAAKRETVVSTILRYQRPGGLPPGDPLPALELSRLDDGSTVLLHELVVGRPLVLVFGSFT